MVVSIAYMACSIRNSLSASRIVIQEALMLGDLTY